MAVNVHTNSDDYCGLTVNTSKDSASNWMREARQCLSANRIGHACRVLNLSVQKLGTRELVYLHSARVKVSGNLLIRAIQDPLFIQFLATSKLLKLTDQLLSYKAVSICRDARYL